MSDRPRQPTAATPTDRSRARNKRAALILGGIALDAEHARMLDAVLAATGKTKAEFVRAAIRQAHSRIK